MAGEPGGGAVNSPWGKGGQVTMDERKDGFRNWTMLSGAGRLKDSVGRSCMKLRKLKVASRTATGGQARRTGCPLLDSVQQVKSNFWYFSFQ